MQALLANGKTGLVGTVVVESFFVDGEEGFYDPLASGDIVLVVDSVSTTVYVWTPTSGESPDGESIIRPLYSSPGTTYVGSGRWVRGSIGGSTNVMDYYCLPSALNLGSIVTISPEGVASLACADSQATLPIGRGGYLITSTIARSAGVLPLGISPIVETGITLADQDILYLSAIEPGRVTNVAPTTPDFVIVVGKYEDTTGTQSGDVYLSGDSPAPALAPSTSHYRGCRVYLSEDGRQTIAGSEQTILSFDRIGYNIDSEFSLGSAPVTEIPIPSTVSRVRFQGKIKIGSLELPETTQYSLALYRDGAMDIILLSGLFPAIEGTPSIVIPFCSPPLSVVEGSVYTLVLGIYVDGESTFETVGSHPFLPHDTTELHVEVLD
jgi:hypothetical protein